MESVQSKENYLSKQNSDCLKGIFAFFVITHHLYQSSNLINGGALAVILQALGYLSVAVFFFLSGYGLMYSFIIKGDGYISNFIKKRILPFWCIELLLAFIYFVVLVSLDQMPDTFDVIRTLLNLIGKTIIINGWYLQVQMFLYLLFFIVFKMLKKYQIPIIFVCCLGFCFVGYFCYLMSTWYESVFAFSLGLFIAKHQKKFDATAEKKWWLKTVGLLLIFGFMFVASLLAPVSIIKLIAKILSSVVFSLLVIFVIKKIKINCWITRFFGRISLEVYVLQGIFLLLFHSAYINITNGWFFCLAAFGSTVFASLLFHPIVKKIYKLFGK
ncbi:MAG: acyltransferase [Spirochaetaceae bacterium]|nr:acyltransferase [Spirochaetaceae bacterium]